MNLLQNDNIVPSDGLPLATISIFEQRYIKAKTKEAYQFFNVTFENKNYILAWNFFIYVPDLGTREGIPPLLP